MANRRWPPRATPPGSGLQPTPRTGVARSIRHREFIVALTAGIALSSGGCSAPPAPAPSSWQHAGSSAGETTTVQETCNPSQVSCEGDLLVTCNADGTASTKTTCPYGCNALSLLCNLCLPGAVSCDGQILQTCSSDGQSETSVDCGAPGCNASLAACDAPACQSGDTQCAGISSFQTCTDGVWGDVQPCPNDGTCDSAEDQCVTCYSGQSKCTNGILYDCASNGVWDSGAPCPTGNCSSGSACGVCTSGDPPQTQCASNGAGIQTCVSGSWGPSTLCGTDGETQEPLSCIATSTPVQCQQCSPGSTATATCSNSTGNIQGCSPDGTNPNYVYQQCSNGCISGTSECMCTAGDARCNGSDSQVCGPGNVWSSSTCANGCDAPTGACNGQTYCSPGQTICINGYTWYCNPSGNAFVAQGASCN
jgi:hypothetical protein